MRLSFAIFFSLLSAFGCDAVCTNPVGQEIPCTGAACGVCDVNGCTCPKEETFCVVSCESDDTCLKLQPGAFCDLTTNRCRGPAGDVLTCPDEEPAPCMVPCKDDGECDPIVQGGWCDTIHNRCRGPANDLLGCVNPGSCGSQCVVDTDCAPDLSCVENSDSTGHCFTTGPVCADVCEFSFRCGDHDGCIAGQVCIANQCFYTSSPAVCE